MDRIMIKELIDACFTAKRVTEIMPELPEGLKPRHIHVIDCIAEIRKNREKVYVSHVSSALNITTPSVTKLINELEAKRIIKKDTSGEDKRFVNLLLTEIGEEYYKTYVVDYHNNLADKLDDLKYDDCINAIKVIDRLYKAVKDTEGK